MILQSIEYTFIIIITYLANVLDILEQSSE